MADIAQIGFKANTSELVDAKVKLEQLGPAAQKAERAQKMLEKAMEAGSRAAVAAAGADLRKANAVLSAARASETATKADIAAASAGQKKAKAAYDAAKASQAEAAAAKAAAAATNLETAAVERLAAAKRKVQSVPSIPRDKPFVSPWGNPRDPVPNNDNNPVQQSAGAMKANVGNIAAQFQDIGVTAAMGMNPLLIALQQGTQLSAVFAQTGGNAFKTIAAAIMQVVSPTALLTIGIVALVAAMVQFVNWTKLAQGVLNFIADILPEVALGVALVGTALTVAFAPAILGMILSIAGAIATALMGAILAIVSTIGAIPIIIGTAIGAFYVFRDDMTQILGVDLVGAAKTGINFIIGAFVAAYNDIKFLWAQLPNIIGAAAVGAANAVIRALNVMISASIAGINKLVQAANAVGGALDTVGIGFNINEIDAGSFKFDEMANTAADTLAGAVTNRNKQLQEDLTKDYLGAIGGAITGAANDASKKLKEFSAGLGADDGKKKKAGGGGKSEGERFEDIVRGAQRSIASLNAEKEALGQTAEETARLKYETQLLNEAQQKNINLTPVQREQLLALAGEMARLEVSTDRAKKALDFSKDLTKGFLNDFIAGIKEGKSVWESFGDAALSVLDKIGQKIVDMTVDSLFDGGGLGKLFGGLFGGGGGLSSFVGKVGLFAKGGMFPEGISGHSNTVVNKPTLFAFAKGAGLMGEDGAEAIMPLKRGSDGSLGVQMHDGGGRKSSNLNFNPVYENTFVLEGAISEEKVVNTIKAAQEQTKEDTKREMIGWMGQFQRDGAF